MKQRQLIGQRKVQEAVPYVNWPSVLTFQMTSQLKTICKHTICRILLPSFLPTLFLYFVIFYLYIENGDCSCNVFSNINLMVQDVIAIK